MTCTDVGQARLPSAAQVISTSVPVLPGARGHAGVFRPAEATRRAAWARRASSPTSPSCVGRAEHRIVPGSRRGRDHSADRRRPPRRLGKAYRECWCCSGSRTLPRLTWLRGRSRRRLQKSSDPWIDDGPRRHAALGLLVSRLRLRPGHETARTMHGRTGPRAGSRVRSAPIVTFQGTSAAFAAAGPPEDGTESRPPDARVAIGRGVQRFGAFPPSGLVPRRWRRLGWRCMLKRPRCSPTRVSPLPKSVSAGADQAALP